MKKTLDYELSLRASWKQGNDPDSKQKCLEAARKTFNVFKE